MLSLLQPYLRLPKRRRLFPGSGLVTANEKGVLIVIAPSHSPVKLATMNRVLHYAAITLSLFLGIASSQAATVVDFKWTGDAGYSALGSFSYDAPLNTTSITESGAGATKYVEQFSISFFDPSKAVLETGASVVDGTSLDRFFRLSYDTTTHLISSLDADIGGTSYQYFLTNLRTPDGTVVGPGVTGFNFFYRPNADMALDIATNVQVTSISQTPEPASISLLASAGLVGMGVSWLRKRNK